MTQEEMNTLVPQKLREMEETQHITVLYAAESGSRAWGFASPDSDFDVRFIYKRPQSEYLRLDPGRDVIELPMDDTWDVSGWDLDKTLRLLYKSNPTLYEWLSSPVCYLTTPFAQRFQPVMEAYFSEQTALNHYLSTARHNIQDNLRRETVLPKRYLYALRPILACEWIRRFHAAPPVLFAELSEAVLPPSLRGALTDLLALKVNGPEKAEIPRISAIDDYLKSEMSELTRYTRQMPPEQGKSWERLNAFFLTETRS